MSQPTPQLTPTQQALASKLTPEYVSRADQALLAQASTQWRKVARVVGAAMIGLEDRETGVPDVWYAGRVAALVSEGKLEARGEPSQMQVCEVRWRTE
jgi:hypothetical protein